MLAQVDIGSTCKSSFTVSRGEDGRRTGGFYVVGVAAYLPSMVTDGIATFGGGRVGGGAVNGVVVVAVFGRSLQVPTVMGGPSVGGGPRKVTQPLPRLPG